MKRTRYPVQQESREECIRRLAQELDREPAIGFAYLYGSFLDGDMVHDIDVGLYLCEPIVRPGSAIASELSARLTALAGIPVDVRVLNDAPLSFRYHVLRGRLLVGHDENLLTAVIEDVARRYLDLAPLLRQGTKDAFAA